MSALDDLKRRYARLLIRTGVNLQRGQSLLISAELAHAEVARLAAAEAYAAGARYVRVEWIDRPLQKMRMLHGDPAHFEYVPDFEAAMYNGMVGGRWARLAFTGEEFPNIFADVDPRVVRTIAVARSKAVKPYARAQMSNGFQWCVAAVPTAAWARQIFPDESAESAQNRLWELIFASVRLDAEDPEQAWDAHDTRLRRVSEFLEDHAIRAIRFFDPAPAGDGRASTDLTIGLTDAPYWVPPASFTPGGVRFFANMPTEELFTSPHCGRADGWVRTSKPSYPLSREVSGAYFRFVDGAVVEHLADQGADALRQFFEIRGATRLGEVALVDVRSPVNRMGILFHDTLFDENAVCHIAFGTAYTEGLRGADAMSDEQRAEAGLNEADAHVDFMIGTPTMNVYGMLPDGSETAIMLSGQFVPELVGG